MIEPMKNLEDYKIYFARYNGIPTYAYVEGADRPEQRYVMTTLRGSFSVAGWRQEVTDIGVGLYDEGGSYIEFADLSLDTVQDVFPTTKRVFLTIEELSKAAKKAIQMVDSYELNTEPDEVMSITITEDGTVAAVVKTDQEGELFTFVDGDWAPVSEDTDNPLIYDLELLDIEREDIGLVLEKWKASQESGSDLPKEDLLPFVALNQ